MGMRWVDMIVITSRENHCFLLVGGEPLGYRAHACWEFSQPFIINIEQTFSALLKSSNDQHCALKLWQNLPPELLRWVFDCDKVLWTWGGRFGHCSLFIDKERFQAYSANPIPSELRNKLASVTFPKQI